jgi:hypothetical protein
VSVLLPTLHPWPAVASALDSLLSQQQPPPFEILLLDGHGQALTELPGDPSVRWIRLPGKDPFELRAAGIAEARGEVVAVMEDHCIAPPDWLARIAAAHDADAAPAIVGAVRNHASSARSAIDRANFILTFAGQTPGRMGAGRRPLPVPTNLSFKRAALPASSLAAGEFEYRWLAELSMRKELSFSDEIVLDHKQSWGGATWAVHLASGRSYGAAVRVTTIRNRAGWWLGFPFVPAKLIRLVMPEFMRGASGKRPSIAEALCLAACIGANLFGQLLGMLFGVGKSRYSL